MNYTIITTQDLQFEQFLDIVKNGNIYSVELTDKQEFVRVSFRTLKEAQEIYLKLVNYFINGLYSFEQRKSILLESKEV